MKTRYEVNIECRCGCGQRISEVSKATYWRLQKGQDVGYLPGHAHRGERNPRWNGGQTLAHGEYLVVFAPEHPNSRKTGYILEHRLVMSEHLGRPLNESEIVHHINGDKQDNRIENLQIVDRVTHRFLHDPNETRYKDHPLKICKRCGKEFIPNDLSNYYRNQYCSKECGLPQGSEHWKAKITENDVLQIRSLEGKLSRPKIAEQFGISASTVKKIHRRDIWKHV